MTTGWKPTELLREDVMKFEISNLKREGLQLGLKLNNSLTKPLNEDEFRRFVRDLKKEFSGKFQQIAMPDSKKGGAIFGKNDSRWIIIDENGLQYRENKSLTGYFFENVSAKLLEFFYNLDEVEPDDVALVGKIFNYTIDLQEAGVNFVQRNIKIFSGEELTELRIKSTIKKEDKYLVHLGIEAMDQDSNKNTISLHVDINNSDQISGVNQTQYEEIIAYANNFVKNNLIDLLNNNFS